MSKLLAYRLFMALLVLALALLGGCGGSGGT